MAYHGHGHHLSHEMGMPTQYAEDNAAVLRTAAAAAAAAAAVAEGGVGGGPAWLNSAILRQQGAAQHGYVDGSFLHLQTSSDSSAAAPAQAAGGGAAVQWLPRPAILQRNGSGGGGGGGGSDVALTGETMMSASGISADPGSSHGGGEEIGDGDAAGGSGGGDGIVGVGEGTWQSARYKADILAHPLYEQLLSAHVACLRIATPVDQLPRIDAQLAQSQHVVAKYSVLNGGGGAAHMPDDKELDQFMWLDKLLQGIRVACSPKEDASEDGKMSGSADDNTMGNASAATIQSGSNKWTRIAILSSLLMVTVFSMSLVWRTL